MACLMNNQESSRSELPIKVPSGLEPAIKDFVYASQVAFALPRGNCDMVNIFTVQVRYSLYTGKLLEFLDRPDAYSLERL